MKQLIDKPLPQRDFLLAPVILERSTTLIYAKTNIGKTWFALCMAYIISVKGCLFDFWHAKKARKVLYIDSEMDESSLQNRVKIIARMEFGDRRYGNGYANKNFFCISKKRSKLDNESFQKNVTDFVKKKKIALIVLDNLTAFTQHNDSAKAWEDIHVWLDILKKQNCAVIIIHHTNKTGEQRGTSATTNAVDNVIRLSDPKEKKRKGKKYKDEFEDEFEDDFSSYPEVNDGMKIVVEIEKGRDIYGEARKKLEIEICPNAPIPHCKLKPKSGHPSSLPRSNKTDQEPRKKNKIDEKKVYETLVGASSVKEAANKLKCSVSRIYQIEGLREHESYKSMKRRNKDKAQEEKQAIEKLFKEGLPEEKIASHLNCSVSTVRRKIIDIYLPHVRGKHSKKISIPSISKRTALPEKIVRQIVNKIELQKLDKLFHQGETVENIIAKVNLKEKVIMNRIENLEKEKSVKADRQHKIEQVRIMLDDGVSIEDIIKQIDLPKRTIIVEYRRWARGNTK